jgi:hypothetical protein
MSLVNREISVPSKSTMVASVGPIIYIVMTITTTSMCPTLEAPTFLCIILCFPWLETCLTSDSD